MKSRFCTPQYSANPSMTNAIIMPGLPGIIIACSTNNTTPPGPPIQCPSKMYTHTWPHWCLDVPSLNHYNIIIVHRRTRPHEGLEEFMLKTRKGRPKDVHRRRPHDVFEQFCDAEYVVYIKQAKERKSTQRTSNRTSTAGVRRKFSTCFMMFYDVQQAAFMKPKGSRKQ